MGWELEVGEVGFIARSGAAVRSTLHYRSIELTLRIPLYPDVEFNLP